MRQHTQKQDTEGKRGKREKVRGRWRETGTVTKTENKSGRIEVERVGEREIDKQCIISPFACSVSHLVVFE